MRSLHKYLFVVELHRSIRAVVRVLGKLLFNRSRTDDDPTQDDVSTEGEEEQIQANIPPKKESRDSIHHEQKSNWNRETEVEPRHGTRKETVKDELASKKFVRC